MLDFTARLNRARIFARGAANAHGQFLSEDYSMSQAKHEKKATNEKPLSLYGVDFKELMTAFLKVKPDKKKAKKKPSK